MREDSSIVEIEASKVEVYERDRAWYKEKYGADVDEPKKELKVSVVIPSFAELESDNFWRMFRSLMYQRGVKQEEYEAICVINNSEEIANLPPDEEAPSNRFEGTSSDLRKQRYKENQDQLRIMKTVKQGQKMVMTGAGSDSVAKWLDDEIGSRDLRISNYERSLMKRFVNTRISLQFVDASSPSRGFERDSAINPIGLARDIGSYLAYNRLKTLGVEGMVDFIDGDCFFDPNYMRYMIEFLESGTDVVVKPLKKVVAEVPRRIEEEPDPYTRVMSAIKYLATVYSSHDYYRDNIDSYGNDGKALPIVDYIGGPQIAIKSSDLPEVGGYSTDRSSEDWAFSRKIIKKYQGKRIGTFKNSCVLMSDRGRDVSTDGRSRGTLSEYKGTQVIRDDDIRNDAESRIGETRRLEENFIQEINTIRSIGNFQAKEWIAEYEAVKQQCYQRNADSRLRLIEKVGHWLEKMAVMDYKNKHAIELIDEMCKNHKVKKSDRDFFEQNLVLVDLAVEVLKMSEEGSDTPEDKALLATMWLETLLPEYFQVPPEKLPDVSKAKESDNVANYSHIDEAIYLMRARLRDRMLQSSSFGN